MGAPSGPLCSTRAARAPGSGTCSSRPISRPVHSPLMAHAPVNPPPANQHGEVGEREGMVMAALSCRLGCLQRAAFMPTVAVQVEGANSQSKAKMLALTDGASSGLILTRKAAQRLNDCDDWGGDRISN